MNCIRVLNLNHKKISLLLKIPANLNFVNKNHYKSFSSIMKPSVYITRQINDEALDILKEQ